jgi:hypothetical protein
MCGRIITRADHLQHCTTQRVRTPHRGINFEIVEYMCNQPDGSVTINGPMGDKQSTGTGIEKCTCKARECVDVEPIASRSVAGGQYHPVSIESQLCDFTCREKPIIICRRDWWWSEHKGWLSGPPAKISVSLANNP